MEDQDSLISQQEEDLFKEQTLEQKSHQQEFLDQNLNIQTSNQMIGLCSPSPFKKQSFPNISEESFQEGSIENKDRKQSGLYRMIFKQSSISDQQNEIQKNQENEKNIKLLKDCKSEKSLKRLSRQVYEIILTLQRATYKEIARQLLIELRKQAKFYDKEMNPKDQQNIRRRVYDALNVMVSANIIQRNGKNVIFESQLSKIKNYILDDNLLKEKEKENKFENHKLKLFLKNKERVIETKKENKEKLLIRLEALKNIVNFNKMRKNQVISSGKIWFPIVGLLYIHQKFKNCRQIRYIKSGKVHVKIYKLLGISGDIDFVMKMNLNREQEESESQKTKQKKNNHLLFTF